MARSSPLSYAHGGSTTPFLGNTIPDCLDRIVARYPDNEALVDVPGGRRWTYTRLREDCRRVAKSLMKLGVRRGDRVAIWSTNHPEWVLSQFGTAIMGAVLVNVIRPVARTSWNTPCGIPRRAHSLLIERFKTSDYVSMFGSVCPEARESAPGATKSAKLPLLRTVVLMGPQEYAGMYTWEQFLALGRDVTDAELDERQASLDIDDVINIQYTSGTTGFPEGRDAHPPQHPEQRATSSASMRVHATEDRLCIPVPFYHCFGMVLGNLRLLTHGRHDGPPGAELRPAGDAEAIAGGALHGAARRADDVHRRARAPAISTSSTSPRSAPASWRARPARSR